MPDIDEPFTPEDFDSIESALALSLKTEEAIKKAKRAGIDLPDQMEKVREQRVRLQQLKQTYFPGR